MITITEASFDDTANDTTNLDKSIEDSNRQNLKKFGLLQRKIRKNRENASSSSIKHSNNSSSSSLFKDFDELDNIYGLNKNLLSKMKINSANNLDDQAVALIMTDDSENSSNFSLNKSSHSYNDSSFDESTSPSRQAYKPVTKIATKKSNDEASSFKSLDAYDNQCVNRNSSVSPPTWRQRNRNTFKRTIRRFHSAFIAKAAFNGSINKDTKNSSKSENENDKGDEADIVNNNKNNKQNNKLHDEKENESKSKSPVTEANIEFNAHVFKNQTEEINSNKKSKSSNNSKSFKLFKSNSQASNETFSSPKRSNSSNAKNSTSISKSNKNTKLLRNTAFSRSVHSLKTKENLQMSSSTQQTQKSYHDENKRISIPRVNLVNGGKDINYLNEIGYTDQSDYNSNEYEMDLFKTASYKKELPRNAVRTKLKKSSKIKMEDSLETREKDAFLDTNINSSDTEDDFLKVNRPNILDPNGSFKKKIVTTTNVLDSPTSKTTITTVTTKTLIKINDVNKSKHMSKRRNTISTIALNKVNSLNRNANGDFLLLTNDEKLSKMTSIEINEINSMDIFEIIEYELSSNIDSLHKKIVVNPESVNSINEFEHTPVDLALMLNNVQAIKLLFRNGAVENPNLTEWNDRYQRVCSKLTELDQELRIFLRNFDVTSLTTIQISSYENKLSQFDAKMKLLKRLKQNYEKTKFPNELTNILLEVHSPKSLKLTFDDPLDNVEPFIIKYMIEWSVNPNFDPIDGQIVITYLESSKKQYIINNLITNQFYYVRVCCANIRGYGPYCLSHPAYLAPSYWREGPSTLEEQLKQIRKLKDLNNLINESKLNGEFVMHDDLNSSQKFTKPKSTLKKNLKSIFAMAMSSNSNANVNSNNLVFPKLSAMNAKFVKQIKKSTAYLVSVVYDGDKVLTTCDENLPMVEIDENYSSREINSDFQFLVKLSFNWNEIDNYKHLIEQTINASGLRFRYLLISAIKQIQSLLEFSELGRVYHQYLKHPNGSVFFLTITSVKPSNSISSNQNLKLHEIEKLLAKINFSLNSSYDDGFLIKNLKVIIEFDSCCEKKLKRGLYVAYLKIQSSIELVKVMVTSQMPNSLPCHKIRDNPNVTKDEWNFIKSLKAYAGNLETYFELNKFNFLFLINVIDAINKLCREIDIKEEEIGNLRVITRELIEVNENITVLLICPPAEQIFILSNSDETSVKENSRRPSPEKDNFNEIGSLHEKKNQNNLSFLKSSPFIYFPVQMFEAVHLNAYDLEFIKTYVKISIKLEIESLASNQYNREAFSNDEINTSKRILNIVSKYQKTLEETWKDYRWLIEAINTAREKDKSQSQQLPTNQTILISDIKLFFKSIIKNREKIKLLNCCKCFLENFFNKQSEIYSKKDIYNQISMLPNPNESLVKDLDILHLTYDENLKNFICNCTNNIRNSKLLLLNSELAKSSHSSFNHIDSVLLDDYDIEDECEGTNPIFLHFKDECSIKNNEMDSKNSNRNSSSASSLYSNSTTNSMASSSNWKKSTLFKNVKSSSLVDEDLNDLDTGKSRPKLNSRDRDDTTIKDSQSYIIDVGDKINANNFVSKLYISPTTTPNISSSSINESKPYLLNADSTRKIQQTNTLINLANRNSPENDTEYSHKFRLRLMGGEASTSKSLNLNENNSKVCSKTDKISNLYRMVDANLATDTSSSSSCSAVSDSLPQYRIETSSSSSSTSLSSTSRNIFVIIDFKTDLKIDIKFECTINNQSTCKDVVYQILKKINSFISLYNEINTHKQSPSHENKNVKQTSQILEINDYDENIRMSVLSSEKEKTDSNITKAFKLVDENFNLYYLVVVFEEKEKALLNTYLLSSLQEPWSKGAFYLRKKRS